MEAKLAALDLSHAPRDESAPRHADADDERPDTSTCWFDRLPYELKYKIARICHDMHLEGRESALHWKKYGNFGPSTTVGALFQVSKEWSDIVAPIHFESLDIAQLISKRHSARQIRRYLCRRGSLVRHMRIHNIKPPKDVWKS
ncbi:hypothetical protein BMF94_3333 [Rhodotorula taiwanensis]|uniref:F-box domain-containing protein n=1 Tax=Rhodotorula taiwanensis TaxID=741276 RepID=A0A2S5BAI6_9BASI|nr:hypothetical protein BMF94_3333 [Rhodotorula taiwanensis]